MKALLTSDNKLDSGAVNNTSEKALEDPMQLLQLIMDNIPQAVFWKDRNCVYIYCNQNFANDAGVSSPKEIRGKTDFDLAWTKEQAIDFQKWDRLVMESRKPHYHIIEPQYQADGKQAWLETNKIPLFDPQGQVVGILGTYEDITERKSADEALRSSQQMLRLILDNIPQAVFWKDRNSVYLGCNQNFAVDAGVGIPENIVNKTDFDLAWSFEQATQFCNWDKQVIDTGKPQYHIIEPQHQADGKQAWLETNKVPLFDANGIVVGILGTYEDITERINSKIQLELRVTERTAELSESNFLLRQEIAERMRVEEELRQSRERYTQAVKAGRVVVWNWDLITRECYTDLNIMQVLDIPESGVPETIDEWIELNHPDDRLSVTNAIRSHLDGFSPAFQLEHRLIDGNQKIHWVLSRGTVIRDISGKAIRMTGSTTDITELKFTEEALQGRDAILVSLAYASQNLLDLSRLNQTLPEVLQQMGLAIGISTAYLYQNNLSKEDALSAVREYVWSRRATDSPFRDPAYQVISYKAHGLTRWMYLMSNGECISGPVGEFTGTEKTFLENKGIRSIVLIPIFSGGSWWGFLGLEDHLQERVWSPGVIGALKSTASALGAAFAQKRSQEAEKEQRVLAQALIDTSSWLNSTLKVEEVLDRILLTIGRVVPHDTANIIMVEGDKAYAARPNELGKHRKNADQKIQHFSLDSRPTLLNMVTTRQPLIISDTHANPGWITSSSTEKVRSYLGAPIEVNGQVIGFINLNSYNDNFFTPVHAERLKAFATQAAIAIQNARLYEQAQELAAMEERQRLARDLHDSVSQTLWTANLIAEVLPTLWEMDIEDGKQNLQRLCKLTRGALAEMRSLLLELRPAAIAYVKLDDLLIQLAEATMSRKKVRISVSAVSNLEVPEDVKLVFYRIAQEGLNNIVKHSWAHEVEIHLSGEQGMVRLSLRDNGRGFDVRKISPGRLGLNIIQERASTIKAKIEIHSQPNRGTELIVIWNDPLKEKS